MNYEKASIIGGSNYAGLAERIANKTGIGRTPVELSVFADGEMSPALGATVREKTVFLILSTNPKGDNLMELLLLAATCKENHAEKVVAIVPYYGYCRQDRKGNSRVSIGSALVGRLMREAGVDMIVNLDLHAIQIQGIFTALGMQSAHIEGHSVLAPYIKRMGLERMVLCSPDIGGVGRTRSMQQHFPDVDMVIIDKTRLKANEIASMRLIGDVEGMDVVMVDDICDTAGTLCKAADYLMEKGARSVRAVITHPIMSRDAYERLEASQIVEMITTSSIPLDTSRCGKITVVDIAPLFSSAIECILFGQSISDLNRTPVDRWL
jgi:ribose-phosphate pyrophosphokinase